MPATHVNRGPIRQVAEVSSTRVPRLRRGPRTTRPGWTVTLECGHTVTVQSEPGDRAYCPRCGR